MRLIKLLLICVLMAGGAAHADINNALGSLAGDAAYSSGGGGGRFKTRTMDGVTFGDAHVRLQQKVFNLVTFDPPSISAGCRGIDMHLGGFSWLSGDQLKAMLNGIAKGAPYVVFQIAMNVLNPTLQKIIGAVSAMMQKIAGFSLDSCQASKALAGVVATPIAAGMTGINNATGGKAGGFLSGIGNMADSVTSAMGGTPPSNKQMTMYSSACDMLTTGFDGLGGANSPIGGSSSDYQAAMQDACSSPKKVAKALWTAISGGTKGAHGQSVALADRQGNTTWNALTIGGYGATTEWPADTLSSALGIAFPKPTGSISARTMMSTIMLSWVGTRINIDGSSGGNGVFSIQSFPATISAKQVLGILLCGYPSQYAADPAATQSVTDPKTHVTKMKVPAGEADRFSLCQSIYGMSAKDKTPTIKVYQCVTASCDPYQNAANMQQVVLGSAGGPAGADLLLYEGLLKQVKDVLTDAIARVQANKPLTQQQRSIIMLAPFPLWQAINTAALMPGSTDGLIINNSNALAMMMAGSIIKNMQRSIAENTAMSNMPPGLAQAITGSASKLTLAVNDETYKDLLKLSAVRDAIMNVVKTTNQAVMKSAYASGINGGDFAASIAQ